MLSSSVTLAEAAQVAKTTSGSVAIYTRVGMFSHLRTPITPSVTQGRSSRQSIVQSTWPLNPPTRLASLPRQTALY